MSVGVPLGVAVIGILGLLLWRQSRKTHVRRQQSPSSDVHAQSNQISDVPRSRENRRELLDTQIPYELDRAAGKVEMPVYT